MSIGGIEGIGGFTPFSPPTIPTAPPTPSTPGYPRCHPACPGRFSTSCGTGCTDLWWIA